LIRVIEAELRKNLKQYFFSARTFVWTIVLPLGNGLYLYFLYLPFGTGLLKIDFLGTSSTVGLIGFTLVGQLLYAFFTQMLLSGSAFDVERWQGTLEGLLLTPASRFGVLLGSAIYGSLAYLWMLGGSVLVWVAFLRVSLFVTDYPALLLSAALSYLSMLALGTCMEAFFIHSRRGVTYGTMAQEPAMFLSGLIFPIQSTPSFLLPLSYFLPLTFGLVALRSTLLGGASLASVSVPLLVLLFMTVAFLLIGRWLIGYAERQAKVKATLTQF
jgi:ABC-2 type transport system permease protein